MVLGGRCEVGRPERREMMDLGKLAKVWELNILFQAEGNSRCKGREAGTSLMHLRRANVAGTECLGEGER